MVRCSGHSCRKLTTLLFALWLFGLPALCINNVAAQNGATIDIVKKRELDTWQGSSLGIRLELKEQHPVVTEVYPHVQNSSPFMDNDKILSIGDIQYPANSLDGLSNLLNTTDPEAELKCMVLRGENEIQLNVTTFRKEFVDIQAIYRQLHKNQIINKHLEATERQGWFDSFNERMAGSVQKSNSPRQAAEALNRIIDEIGVSHTAIIPSSAGISFSQKPKGGIGILLQRHRFDDRAGYFIVDMKPGSPSAGSELLLGDEILSINSVPIESSRRLTLSGHEDRHQLFTLNAGIDEQLRLEVLSSPFEDSRAVVIESERDLSTIESVRESVRTIESGERKIGYLRFWNLMSMKIGREFNQKLEVEFAQCEAVIMDLRGRGGIVPVVTALNRSVAKMDKPVVVIIDDLTRSAKEMLAFLLKKHENVWVVGMKTAGAVTGATMQKLPSGNMLMFPVASANSLKRFIDGAVIEGVGVAPDETVKYFIPYSGGNDRLLKVATKRAVELASKRASDIRWIP